MDSEPMIRGRIASAVALVREYEGTPVHRAFLELFGALGDDYMRRLITVTAEELARTQAALHQVLELQRASVKDGQSDGRI